MEKGIFAFHCSWYKLIFFGISHYSHQCPSISRLLVSTLCPQALVKIFDSGPKNNKLDTLANFPVAAMYDTEHKLHDLPTKRRLISLQCKDMKKFRVLIEIIECSSIARKK